MNKIYKEFEEIKTYYLLLLKNAFRFGGRATRKEFWYGSISHYIFLAFISPFLEVVTTNTFANVLKYFVGIYLLIGIIGLLSIYFRRMRDVGKSNLFALGNQILCFIPILGIFFLIRNISFLCKPSLINDKYK